MKEKKDTLINPKGLGREEMYEHLPILRIIDEVRAKEAAWGNPNLDVRLSLARKMQIYHHIPDPEVTDEEEASDYERAIFRWNRSYDQSFWQLPDRQPFSKEPTDVSGALSAGQVYQVPDEPEPFNTPVGSPQPDLPGEGTPPLDPVTGEYTARPAAVTTTPPVDQLPSPFVVGQALPLEVPPLDLDGSSEYAEEDERAARLKAGRRARHQEREHMSAAQRDAWAVHERRLEEGARFARLEEEEQARLEEDAQRGPQGATWLHNPAGAFAAHAPSIMAAAAEIDREPTQAQKRKQREREARDHAEAVAAAFNPDTRELPRAHTRVLPT